MRDWISKRFEREELPTRQLVVIKNYGKAYCPSCDEDLHGKGTMNFCPICGQMLKFK